MKKKRGLSLIQKRNAKGFIFILPWLIGFLAFYVRGLVMNIQFSLSDLSVPATGGYTLKWVGFANYIKIFTAHGSFKQVLTSSTLDMLIDVPLIIFFSLFIALLLNNNFKGRGIVRAIFFLPVILNAEAITASMKLLQTFMASGVSSTSTELASSGGISVDYFISLFKNIAMPDKVLDYIVTAVTRVKDIISGSGVQIVLFIAALQSIPGSMYEVAKIEGATGYETFWKVTFPMVMPHIITNLVYTIIDRFARSEVVDLAYKTTFKEFLYGQGAAMSVVSTAVVGLILIIVVGIIQKRTFYYN